MRTKLILLGALAAQALNASATMVVIDPTKIAQDAGNEVVNLAKWTKTEVDAAQTEINTLRTYENTVLQVARMGNPAALQQIPVVGTIAELAGDGQKLLAEYNQVRALTDPQRLKANLSTVQSAYGLGAWNPLSPGAYQFPSASYQVSQSVQDQLVELEKQRQTLERKRDQTLQAMQSATDQSTVQKLTGALVGVNGGLAEIAAREQALAQKGQLQRQQLEAGRAVQRQQITETTAAGFSYGVRTEMDQLNQLAPDYTKGPILPEGR
jgi:hypothetical protein